ncbi:hypothetical protein TNCV_1570971 [Trichonephila clavipes]|uniref:Uncharacterized protein n=1 Tax=Trichonephila clavipes TaxID=2585209 RepID=A0A8X6SNB0_TRICX|nr:hypothetical protein TNCV_1570971 [Trichonephila clavipes]
MNFHLMNKLKIQCREFGYYFQTSQIVSIDLPARGMPLPFQTAGLCSPEQEIGDRRNNPTTRTKSDSSTRRLLATDHVILNHGQVTWTTPELVLLPPSQWMSRRASRFHTTGRRFEPRAGQGRLSLSPLQWVDK